MSASRAAFRDRQRGQAVVEYVILLVFIAGLGVLITRRFPNYLGLLERPLREKLVLTYKYGDPLTCGDDDSDPSPRCSGSAQRHPRIWRSGNFRLFRRSN